MNRSPLDFYHQHIWKFQRVENGDVKERWGCTRCGELFANYDEVVKHCDDQECENTNKIEWLEAITP